MCKHPAHQVNIPKKDVSCGTDFSQFSKHPSGCNGMRGKQLLTDKRLTAMSKQVRLIQT